MLCPAQLQSSLPHTAVSLPEALRCQAPAQGIISVPREGWHLTCWLAETATSIFKPLIPPSYLMTSMQGNLLEIMS